jgi:hypothetical protein
VNHLWWEFLIREMLPLCMPLWCAVRAYRNYSRCLKFFHHHNTPTVFIRLHSIHCVVKSRNKLLWPTVCRRAENDNLTCLFQISDETNVLQDGTLIDLCGATLLWRSHEGLEKSPVSWIYVWYTIRGIQVFSYEPMLVGMLLKTGCLYLSIKKCECWHVQHTTYIWATSLVAWW